MELPAAVEIHNQLMGMKGRPGRLLGVHPEGYYEVTTSFGDREHRVLLPIGSTVLIASEAEQDWESSVEVER